MRILHPLVTSLRHTDSSKISYLVWNSTSNRESQQKRNMTVVNNRLDTELDLSGSHARYNKFSPFSCSPSLFVQQLLSRLIERSLVLGHGPLPRGIRVLCLTNEPAYLPGSKHHREESGYKNFFVFTK